MHNIPKTSYLKEPSPIEELKGKFLLKRKVVYNAEIIFHEAKYRNKHLFPRQWAIL